MYLNNLALKNLEESYTQALAKIGSNLGSNLGFYGGIGLGALTGLGLGEYFTNELAQSDSILNNLAQHYPNETAALMDVATVPIGMGVGGIAGELAGAGLGAGVGSLFGGAIDLRKKIKKAIGLNNEKSSNHSKKE